MCKLTQSITQFLKSQIGFALAIANKSFCLCSGPRVKHLCLALQSSIHPGLVKKKKRRCLFLSVCTSFLLKNELSTRPECMEDCSAMHKCWTLSPLLFTDRKSFFRPDLFLTIKGIQFFIEYCCNLPNWPNNSSYVLQSFLQSYTTQCDEEF